MALVSINWRPDRKTLAAFSEFGMSFLGMVAAPLAYFRSRPTLAAAFWVAAVIGRLRGALRPEWLKPAYLGLTLATRPIGWVISHLTMALLYYGVVTPIGRVFRALGRDPLAR